MRYPRIIAHRCGGALAPENTLSGLRVAARLGCRGVEFDAMLSADGIPILIHDDTLERTTSGRGGVGHAPLADLARLDAGIRHHRAFAGEPVPTLVQALEVCADLGLWANVEIKPFPDREVETGRRVAEATADFGNVLLSSFSVDALRQAADVAEAKPRALLVDAVGDDWVDVARELGARGLHVAASLASAELLRPLRGAGIPVACFTVNRRDLAERLFADGVTAVFTDRPDLWLPAEM